MTHHIKKKKKKTPNNSFLIILPSFPFFRPREISPAVRDSPRADGAPPPLPPPAAAERSKTEFRNLSLCDAQKHVKNASK